MRFFALFFCLLTAPGTVWASSALLRVPATGAPGSITVTTYSGTVEAQLSSVQPSQDVTILLLMDTIAPEQLASLKHDLLAAFTVARGGRLRLGLLQGSNLVFAGPFKTRLRFKSVLDEIHLPSPAASPAASPVSGETIVESIFNNVAQLGANWSSAVLVGNAPTLDPLVTEYGVALLLREFTAHQIRASWLSPAPLPDPWLPLIQATGGEMLAPGLSDLQKAFDSSGTFQQSDWTLPLPSAGFILGTSTLKDQTGAILAGIPELSARPEASFPTMALYSQLRAKAAAATTLLLQPALSAEAVDQVRDALKFALGINPRDAESLTAAASLYEKFGDYSGAARCRASLLEVFPQDGAAYALAGHDYLLASDLENGENALQGALRLNTRTQQVLEDFARLKIARKDDRGALPYLDEALQVDPKRQDLWFVKAEVAVRLAEPALAISSYEHGLELGGLNLDAISSLLKLYLESQQKSKAVILANDSIRRLPADAAVRTQFALSMDGLHLGPEALAVWRRVIEVQPQSQRAHERIARLLLEASDFTSAEEAATAGLAVAPHSSELYIVKSEALEKQGHLYAARKLTEEAAELVPETQLLQRLALLEETFVGRGAPAYEKWSEAANLSPSERVGVLQRGLEVSLRDGDMKRARTFVNSLSSSGHPDIRDLVGKEQNSGELASIPGGLSALAFMAHASDKAQADKFFVEFSRALIDHISLAEAKEAKSYVSGVDQYLEKLASLESMGKRDAAGVKIILSLQGKEPRKRTVEVLNLLGIKLGSGKNGIELDFGQSKSQAKKQETLAALAIDQVGMQEAFQAGKPYILEIPYDTARIYPNEKLWRETFYPRESQPGGLVGTLLHSPKVARLYLGMSFLDRDTITQLLSSTDLRTLNDRYAELFSVFAPAFAVHNGRAVCAGGADAEPIWEALVGVSPQKPGQFFRALLEKDKGKLLFFFYTLSHLDRSRQAFFTASTARTSQFYRLFVESKEGQPGLLTMRDTSFEDFLRSVPLASNGHVNFPGSPAVWMVAKGHASADSKMAQVSKASSRWAGSDVEDEVMLRLAQARYREKSGAHSELDNFLAVSHIDAHRPTPLDEASALLLAQRYTDSSATYPYFADLTGLTLNDFRQFYTLLDQLSSLPPIDANLRLGQLHALVQWICLLRQRDRVSEEHATMLFRSVMHLGAVANASDYAAVSLDSANAIIQACRRAGDNGSHDDMIRQCLAGTAPGREQEFQRVLELQKAPGLETLFSIQAAAGSVGTATVDTAVLNKMAAALPLVEIPPKVKLAGKEKDLILRYQPASVQRICSRLAQKSETGKRKIAELDALRHELMHALEPQVALALAGVVYAYYLRPSDLVIAEDPLLLRKHRFANYIENSKDKDQSNMVSNFFANSEGGGSYFSGGFAEFPLAVGDAAAALLKSGGESGGQAISAQLAALRSTSWDLIGESELRLLGLRVAVAREWIVEAAVHPEAQYALGEATMGLLSLSRRADLLNAVAARNWEKAWETITLPDLFALGSVYLQYFKSDVWTSPVTTTLRTVTAQSQNIHWQSLGSLPYHAFGCSHPHWISMAPYEEYEHRFFPPESSERWAQFKLFLAFQADVAGEEPSELARVAEKLAAKAYRSAQMSDFNDWRSLMAGYASITSGDVERALQQ